MLRTVVGMSRGHERISCYVGYSKDVPSSCHPNSLVLRRVAAALALAAAVENTMALVYGLKAAA